IGLCKLLVCDPVEVQVWVQGGLAAMADIASSVADVVVYSGSGFWIVVPENIVKKPISLIAKSGTQQLEYGQIGRTGNTSAPEPLGESGADNDRVSDFPVGGSVDACRPELGRHPVPCNILLDVPVNAIGVSLNALFDVTRERIKHCSGSRFGRVIVPHVPVPKERWRPIDFGQFSPSVAAKPFHLEQSVLSCRVPSTVISSRLSAGKDVWNTEGVANDRNLFAVQFD